MRRTIALGLAAILLLCALTAIAEGDDALTFEEAGVTLNLTDAYRNLKGVLVPDGGSELVSGSGIYVTSLYYIAMTTEEFNTLVSAEEITDADRERAKASIDELFSIIGVNGGRDFSAVNDFFGGALDESKAVERGRAEDCTFYTYVDTEPDFAANLATEYAEEHARLLDGLDALMAAADFYAPEDPYAGMMGKTLSFSTTDLDGAPVDSAALFAQHELTMLNIWASWCGPCVNELQALQEINDRLSEKGCAVVGLLYDGDSDSAIETARQLLKERNVSYTVILPPENAEELFMVEAFPTTYFVDKTGAIVGGPIVGAAVDAYESAALALLE